MHINCIACLEGTVKREDKTIHRKYNGKTLSINLSIPLCNICGASIMSAKVKKDFTKKLNSAKRRCDKLSQPKALDLLDKKYNCFDMLKSDLFNNFYPECKFVYESELEKNYRKYMWDSKLVFEYYGSLYLANIISYGNGGWQEIDEYQIESIYIVNKVSKNITVTEYERA